MIEVYSFNNFILYASEDDFKNFTTKNKIDMVDNEGYRYFLNKGNVSCIKRRQTIPARFFDLNPYTEDNIMLYLKKKTNGEIYVLDFCNAKNAHDGILLYDSNIDISYKKSWNEIKSEMYILKKKYPDYMSVIGGRKVAPSLTRLSQDFIRDKFKEKNLIMVGDYINNITPVEFICEKHKDIGIQRMSWTTMKKSKYPCKCCRKEHIVLKSDNEFQEEIKDTKNPNIEVIGKYIKSGIKIECKCNKCGRTIFLRLDHIRRGIGCGYCTKSIGEDRVETFLKNHNLKYEREYRFTDCVRVQRPMPFDFYVPDKNTVIEFDGVQHFQAIGKFGGQESFTQTILNDDFKTEYCKNKGINLIRINYKELDKINEILSEKLINL